MPITFIKDRVAGEGLPLTPQDVFNAGAAYSEIRGSPAALAFFGPEAAQFAADLAGLGNLVTPPPNGSPGPGKKNREAA